MGSPVEEEDRCPTVMTSLREEILGYKEGRYGPGAGLSVQCESWKKKWVLLGPKAPVGSS